MNLSTLIERFKVEGNKVFPLILKAYETWFKKWFRHVSKSRLADYDTFKCDFALILYNALVRFNRDHPDASANNGFDKYLAVSIHNYVTDLRRRKSAERKSALIPLSLCEHDIVDPKPDCSRSIFEVLDVVNTCIHNNMDRNILMLKMSGHGIDEICDSLSIKKREYWTRVDRIRRNKGLLSSVEC